LKKNSHQGVPEVCSSVTEASSASSFFKKVIGTHLPLIEVYSSFLWWGVHTVPRLVKFRDSDLLCGPTTKEEGKR